MNILLTKSTMPVLGWIADILGLLMNGIFYVLNAIGIPNVGLAIILYTIVMYLFMTPLQIKQQKFSKLNSIMSPELQKIQKKYAGKKDQVSMTKMQEETQAVYQKYGVSPTGSCVQLIIQMPVLLALYQVIYHIPGYINIIGDRLTTLAESSGFAAFFTKFIEGLDGAAALKPAADTTEALVDVLYKLNPAQWGQMLTASASEGFHNIAQATHESLSQWTNFLGLNISDTPFTVLTGAWANKEWLLIIAALLIPVLAWLTQMLNYKLMPQVNAQTENKEPGTMETTMKSMNTFMPIMSAVFCFTLPVGIGIYWIAGAVVRSVQQVVINRHMNKVDVNDLIKTNLEKANKKREKKGLPPQKITNQAKLNVRNLEVDQEAKQKQKEIAEKQKQNSTAYYNSNAKPGSLSSKANMVKQFDERSKKK